MPRNPQEKDREKQVNPANLRPSYLRGTGPRRSRDAQTLGPAEPAKENAPTETREAPPEPKEDKEIYTWKVWLLPRRPWVSVAVVATLIGSLILSYWAFPSPFFIAIIAVVLINRLAPYLFPVRYVLSEHTVGYKTLFARDIREWNRFFTYREFPDGVLLALDPRVVRNRFREGLFLYYSEDRSNKDEVLKIVSQKLKPPAEALKPEQKDRETYKGGIGSAIRRIRNIRKKS